MAINNNHRYRNLTEINRLAKFTRARRKGYGPCEITVVEGSIEWSVVSLSVWACMGVHPRAVTLDARVKLRAGGYYIAKLKEKKTNRSRAVLGDHVAQCRK